MTGARYAGESTESTGGDVDHWTFEVMYVANVDAGVMGTRFLFGDTSEATG